LRDSRRTRLTLVLLLLTAFTLTALDYNSQQTGPLASLRRGIDTVFGPVQRALGGAASSVGDALGGLPRLGSYQSDNNKLERENARLRGVIASQSNLQCRLDQYLGLQHLASYMAYDVLPGQVVSMGPSTGFEWVATINVGTSDGVDKDMTVVTGAGLVGRTLRSTAHTSQVLLLADADFEVGGTLANLGLPGFAKGDGSGPMLFSIPDRNRVVKKGVELLTTGSGTYAAGVPIGRVLDINRDLSGSSRTARIQPFVDVTSLDVIGVIRTPKTTSPAQPLVPVAPSAAPSATPCAPATPQGTPSPSPSP
jgi:rod shape-determining protein MreC